MRDKYRKSVKEKRAYISRLAEIVLYVLKSEELLFLGVKFFLGDDALV